MTDSNAANIRKLFLFLATGLWLLLQGHGAAAFELSLHTAGGYDDNPYQEKGSSGAAFVESELDLDLQLPHPTGGTTTFTLQGFAGYRDYDGLDDVWQLGGGLTSSTYLSRFSGAIEFFTEAAAYRNRLVADNDFNLLSLGNRLVWFSTSRLTLEWENRIDWEEYRSAYDLPGKGSHSGKNSLQPGKSHPPGMTPRHHNWGERSDRVLATELKVFYALNPFWDTTGEFFWRTRHSSIDAEKNRNFGTRLSLLWHPCKEFEGELNISAERTPYRYKLKQQKRTEKTYGAGIALAWRHKNLTLSAEWQFYNQNSDIAPDDYSRNQWLGRLKYSY
jgi:hypothetical protein